MCRTLLVSLAAAAMLATAGGAVGSEVTSGYSFENAWPSKVGAKSGKKGGGLKAKTAGQKKESGEKGGTEDINIGVGEL